MWPKGVGVCTLKQFKGFECDFSLGLNAIFESIQIHKFDEFPLGSHISAIFMLKAWPKWKSEGQISI